VRDKLQVSERRACLVLGQARSTQRHTPQPSEYEERLVEQMIDLATRYGRYGYRRITGLLRYLGWRVNHKRIERLWRREGLKVPKKQPKRGRLWLGDGSCIRRRPEHRNHVWAYDFIADRTHDGRPLKMLTIVDEFTRECLAIVVARRMKSIDVLQVEI
jgi:putative transposase